MEEYGSTKEVEQIVVSVEITTTKPGDATHFPVKGQTCRVHYEAFLSSDGSKFDSMCAYWGINATSARQIEPAHVGVAAPFLAGLRRDTLEFLKAQYDFVADNFADLPENWQKNRELLA